MHKNTVKRDKFDELMYHETVKGIEPIQEFFDTNNKKGFHQADELLKDTYNTFYKMQPELLDREKIEKDYQINREIIDKAMKTDEYNELRSITQLDEANSAFATVSFLNDIQHIIDEFLKQQKEQQNGQGQGGGQNQQENGQGQNIPFSAIQSAMSEAVKETKDMNDAIQGLSWGTEEGKYQKMDAKKRMEIAEKLEKNRKLMKLAKIIGKMKNLALSTTKSRVKRVPQEVFSVTQGDDIANMLPSEVIKLTDPDLEDIFIKDLTEHNLMVYDIKAGTMKEKGDIYVCLDLSGSMVGQREIWAKAVAIAVLNIAKKDRRGYTLVPFNKKVHTEHIIKIPRGKQPELSDIIHLAEMYTGGGTNFNAVLDYALKDIEKSKKEKPEILFLSDGFSEVDAQKIKKKKKELDIRIISVAINTDITASIREISDMAITINNLSDLSAEKIFKTL